MATKYVASSVPDPWHFGTDPDPCTWFTDPDLDPALFVSDFQNDSKKYAFFFFVLFITFCRYIYMEEAGAGSVQITTYPDTGGPKKTYGTDPALEHWVRILNFYGAQESIPRIEFRQSM